MPDTTATGSSTPVLPLDAAQVLEDAADLLLIRGVCRDGTYGVPGGRRCVVGALGEVCGKDADAISLRQWTQMESSGFLAARRALYQSTLIPDHNVTGWNDGTEDDDEVRDMLLLVAKDLRNEARPS